MRKISRKLNKSQKSLLIGMLIGDGSISSKGDYKIDHSPHQLDYLKWKLSLLESENIKTTGLKLYKSSSGFNKGADVYRVRICNSPTIKALRKSVYIPEKTITLNLLKWLTPREIALWYMDDGSINVNTSSQRSNIQHTNKIATCTTKEQADIIIDYFNKFWNIKFVPFIEHGKKKDWYSVRTSTEQDCKKFNNLIYPYIKEVPNMLYKIRNNYTKEEFINLQKENSEVRDLLFL